MMAGSKESPSVQRGTREGRPSEDRLNTLAVRARTARSSAARCHGGLQCVAQLAHGIAASLAYEQTGRGVSSGELAGAQGGGRGTRLTQQKTKRLLGNF